MARRDERFWKSGCIALIVAIHAADPASAQAPAGRGDRPDPLLCKPAGQGPSAVVIWNHGLVTDRATFANAQRSWQNMCEALADEGYLAYVPIRRFVATLGPAQLSGDAGELDRVVSRIVAFPDVDRNRVGLMGHSRGATLALMVAVRRKDLAAVVLTAPARIPPRFFGGHGAARAFDENSGTSHGRGGR